MKQIMGRVWAALVIIGVIGLLSSPSLAAGLPASPSNSPVNSKITFIKITDGITVKMVNTTKAPLVLDKQGCRYEPAYTGKPVSINNDVKITSDGIAVYDAVIDGDLFVYGNNVVLNSVRVSGNVFIVSGQDVALDYCSIDGNIEMIDSCEEDSAAYGETQPQDVFADKSGAAGEKAAYADLTVPDPDPNESSADPGSSGAPSAKPAVVLMESISIDDYNSKYIVANKTRMLPANWKPNDLVTIRVPYRGRNEAKYLRREASDALTSLFENARKGGIALCGISGFRSYELQKSVYYKYTKQLGEKTAEIVSAKPGTSEHQTGLSIDISAKSINYALSNSFANTREGKWLAENAAEFGFILRYPKGKEAITGYVYEPWHFRYIGRELAIDITKKGMTLEEYYGIAQKAGEQKLIADNSDIFSMQ